MNHSNIESKLGIKKVHNKTELKKTKHSDLITKSSQRHLVNISFLKQYNKTNRAVMSKKWYIIFLQTKNA